MPGGNEVRSRTFRWREIAVRGHGDDNTSVAQQVAKWLGDKDLCFTKVNHIDAQAVGLSYGPSFDDADRQIVYAAVKKHWPKADIAFYGEEVVVILRSAVCLDRYIQGSDS